MENENTENRKINPETYELVKTLILKEQERNEYIKDTKSLKRKCDILSWSLMLSGGLIMGFSINFITSSNWSLLWKIIMPVLIVIFTMSLILTVVLNVNNTLVLLPKMLSEVDDDLDNLIKQLNESHQAQNEWIEINEKELYELKQEVREFKKIN